MGRNVLVSDRRAALFEDNSVLLFEAATTAVVVDALTVVAVGVAGLGMFGKSATVGTGLTKDAPADTARFEANDDRKLDAVVDGRTIGAVARDCA